jgi:HPt (histidine-containing phosphotransfer) domain-containing protein
MNPNSFDSEFQKLKDKYLITFPNKLGEIEALLVAQDLATLQERFHKLKGNGQTYGFPEITEIARLVEEHGKLKSPDFLRWAALGLGLLNVIHPLLVKKETVHLDTLPDYKLLTESLTTISRGNP